MHLKSGDVLELECQGSYAYLIYIGRHAQLGGTIRVIPKLFAEQPTDLEAIGQMPGYVTFYPVGAALRAKLVKRIGHSSRGEASVPVWVRNAINVDADGRVRSWLVTDGDQRIPRQALSAEEQELPIATIWNHPLLVHRISTGWSPRDEYLQPR
jgi:hypothetical protein